MARNTPTTKSTKSTRKAGKTRPAADRGRRPDPEPSGNNWVVLGLIVVLAVVLAVVLPQLIDSGDEGAEGGAPGGGSDPGVAHVHGLGVDPADGTLYAATHHGMFRIPESGTATRIADRFQDTMGFTVVGPRTFLGSGHPDLRENRPSRLGLIESTDAGETWRALSLEGEADFHALKAAHGKVYGFDSASARFMVTQDRKSWDTRSVTPMLDFDVSPTDPDTILAATREYGVARSTDGGKSFATVTNAPPLVLLTWPAADLLYGVTPAGGVMVSADGGATWQQRGSLDGKPEALLAEGKQKLHAATKSGIYTSTDGGRTFQSRYRN